MNHQAVVEYASKSTSNVKPANRFALSHNEVVESRTDVSGEIGEKFSFFKVLGGGAKAQGTIIEQRQTQTVMYVETNQKQRKKIKKKRNSDSSDDDDDCADGADSIVELAKMFQHVFPKKN